MKKQSSEQPKKKPAFWVGDVMLSLPDDSDIDQVACDEMQQDWNDLRFREVYRQAFVDGATWMRQNVLKGNGV